MVVTSVTRVWVGDKKLKLQWNGSVYKVIKDVPIVDLPQSPLIPTLQTTYAEVGQKVEDMFKKLSSNTTLVCRGKRNLKCFGYPFSILGPSPAMSILSAYQTIVGKWMVKSYGLVGTLFGKFVANYEDCDDRSENWFSRLKYLYPGIAVFECFGDMSVGNHAWAGMEDDKGDVYEVDTTFMNVANLTKGERHGKSWYILRV